MACHSGSEFSTGCSVHAQPPWEPGMYCTMTRGTVNCGVARYCIVLLRAPGRQRVSVRRLGSEDWVSSSTLFGSTVP